MPIKKKDVRGGALVNVQLLVFYALRYIATGYAFDALDVLTCVARETHCVFVRDIFSN